jgi:hypothetical protein
MTYSINNSLDKPLINARDDAAEAFMLDLQLTKHDLDELSELFANIETAWLPNENEDPDIYGEVSYASIEEAYALASGMARSLKNVKKMMAALDKAELEARA